MAPAHRRSRAPLAPPPGSTWRTGSAARSPQTFSRAFSRAFGQTPSAYRANTSRQH
ncbi:AraC family transcriptional regulator [Rhodovulum sp. ES.010]|uniref:AraC family transcriptional regulator n=1 Tax=Rhodovulum sp. ES.010 TaxID=1882821 RepID=UPI00352F0C96